MTYATPEADLIKFSEADVMIYSEGEKGELKPDNPFMRSEMVIRDIEDI